MTFDSLGLSKEILDAIAKKGYTKPSVIQEKAIPEVLSGKDVLASAQTGTGKTAGFVLPILQLLKRDNHPRKRPIRSLVLTPTRELAAQILENAREYSEFIDFKPYVIYGGVNQNPQVRALSQGVDMLIATPGRLLDLHNQKALSLAQVEILVLDEADRMLDMGFARDINKILALLPKKRQNLLFSATFSKEIKRMASGILNNPVQVEAAPKNSTAEKVDQRIIRVDNSRKPELVHKLISEGDWQQVLIFTRTKHGANRLAQKLDKKGISACAIHGNKSQNQRTLALKEFKAGKKRVMVATDIAARGLDIPLLPHVINYELPNVSEDYVHRIGRTGRAGASGEAVSLVSIDEMEYVRGIEKLLNTKIPSSVVEGYEPVDKATTAEDKKQQNRDKQKAQQNRRRKGGIPSSDRRNSNSRNKSKRR